MANPLRSDSFPASNGGCSVPLVIALRQVCGSKILLPLATYRCNQLRIAMSSLQQTLIAVDMEPGADVSPITRSLNWKICTFLDARSLGRLSVLDSTSRKAALEIASGLSVIHKLPAREHSHDSDLPFSWEWEP